MESDDPICVHFLFKCKIINNAQTWGNNPICFWTLVVFNWFFIPITCLFGRQTFLSWYLVPSWKVKRVCLFLDDIFIIWLFAFSCYLFKMVSSIMCWFWVFDRIWTILFLVTLVCAFLVWLVSCPNCISFGYCKSCACIFTISISYGMLTCVEPIYMMNSIKS